MKFCKYHGLGNDYIVINPADLADPLTTDQIRLICHRNYGAGSDGILLGPLPSQAARFALRIFNPDGSEAEKSGNGLRIFCRYLWDQKLVGTDEFAVETAGGIVRATVFDGGRNVRVDMGRVRFWSDEIPATGPRREVLNERVSAGGEELVICAATIGNPHCVVVGRPAPGGLRPLEPVSAALARRLGPHLENHPMFPRRTNVQFLNVLDRANIRIEIWERGAGYTLASGSSSSAAAAVAHRLGWCDRRVSVHMPGGVLQIEIADDFAIRMTGPVLKVVEGQIADEAFEVRVSD
ncbi:MAG: diaminopimelate epimerase [Verrucomicrobiae bacterium]|nr:diaminopimelate epimerase [Verrucomicrobiae bacterium]